MVAEVAGGSLLS